MAAERFLVESLGKACLPPERQGYEVRGRTVHNLVAEVPGAEHRDEILVVGGHYDSAVGTPGANDNASDAAGSRKSALRAADQAGRWASIKW